MNEELQRVLEDCRQAILSRAVAVISPDGDILAVAGKLDGIAVMRDTITMVLPSDLTIVGVYGVGGEKTGELIAMGPETDDSDIQTWAERIGAVMTDLSHDSDTPPSHHLDQWVADMPEGSCLPGGARRPMSDPDSDGD